MAPKKDVNNTTTPTTPGNKGSTGAGPTPQEAMFFFNVLSNMKNKPEIDWDGVAQSSGLKNGGTASVRFGQIRRKYGLATPTKAGNATKASAVGSGTIVTPSKVTKTAQQKPGGSDRKMPKKSSVKKIKEEEGLGDYDEEKVQDLEGYDPMPAMVKSELPEAPAGMDGAIPAPPHGDDNGTGDHAGEGVDDAFVFSQVNEESASFDEHKFTGYHPGFDV